MEIVEKRLVDDLLHAAGDGTKDDGTVERVTFSFGGKYYEIDLNGSNRADFEAYLERWTKHARKVAPPGSGRRGSKNARLATDSEIRQWALDAGLENVPDRGRIRKELREAYYNAH
ncbi:MAG: hypothetical protein ACJA07_001495 [Rhodococcus sp. (in: high G+C Gram-positive bacteria)]|jgi:hypothetical protein